MKGNGASSGPAARANGSEMNPAVELKSPRPLSLMERAILHTVPMKGGMNWKPVPSVLSKAYSTHGALGAPLNGLKMEVTGTEQGYVTCTVTRALEGHAKVKLAVPSGNEVPGGTFAGA